MEGRTRMSRGTALTYLAWGLILVVFGISAATQNGTWQSEALAQTLEINADTSRGVLGVTVNLAEGELLSIEVMGPGSTFVVDEDVASSSFTWAPGADNPDGLYRYEIQVVDRATGNMIGRKAGTFMIRDGEIRAPREVAPVRNNRRGMLHDVRKYLARGVESVMSFLVPAAEAYDLTTQSTGPYVQFDDTDDEDCSQDWDWLIWANGGSDDADGMNWFAIYGRGEAATNNCHSMVPIVWINHNGAEGANSSIDSLVIDDNGDLRFAINRMFFDRANSRLGIGLTTPGYTLDAVGDRIRLRNSTLSTARSVALRNDGIATDLEAQHSDLWIRADMPISSPAHNIYMLSNKVGVGTTEPDSKLHVIGQTPPQFIVQNDAGNARMDFRRSSATGVSQLLFGTGSLSGGTMDYQIGMFLNTIFQIRVTNDSTRGIALTPGGNVGIGKTAPAAKLDVAGIVRATGFDGTSDVRLKDNVRTISGALGKVMGVEGVSFTWKRDGDRSGEFPEGMHYGVVAQQVEEVMPEVVRTAPGGEKAVSYTELVPVLIEAIKEQQKTIKELREEIAAIRMASGLGVKVAAATSAE